MYRITPIPEWVLKLACDRGKGIRLLAIVEDWCGDASNTVPVLAKLGDEASCLEMRVIERDENPEVMDRYLTNGARSIPIVIVLNEEHLQRLLREFLDYYHNDRTHLSLGKDPPAGRAVCPPSSPAARVASVPRIGGLHTTDTSGERPPEQGGWSFGEAQERVADGRASNCSKMRALRGMMFEPR